MTDAEKRVIESDVFKKMDGDKRKAVYDFLKNSRREPGDIFKLYSELNKGDGLGERERMGMLEIIYGVLNERDRKNLLNIIEIVKSLG